MTIFALLGLTVGTSLIVLGFSKARSAAHR